MTTSEKQRVQQAELHKKLWAMSNDLRGHMEPNEFKSYILGLIFYRFLSEKVIHTLDLGPDESYKELWEIPKVRERIIIDLTRVNGFVIPPDLIFDELVNKINAGTFEVSDLQEAVNAITHSTIGETSQADFEHLFEDMDLNNSKLGNTVTKRSETMAKIMRSIAALPFVYEDITIDVLGDAYEYLIGQFAANAGSKAGEFFTPQQVSKVLAKIVTHDKSALKSVYDPTAGSGSLLLRVKRELDEKAEATGIATTVGKFYGQELTGTTYNLARMNMLLHDVPYQHFDIRNGDTLEEPWHRDMRFSAVVANPPYSAGWSADPKFLNDERFSAYGKLAPKSKADFAFIQHMIHQLDDDGTMAVVLPHGVLFRGAAEGAIRKYLIDEKNYLDAVIGLPEKLFFGTQIATAILVFKKCRKPGDDVLFIDASNDFEKGKNQNSLTDENVEKIVAAYSDRAEIERYSHKATLDEIRENDFNLNIPRYVDTYIQEAPIDLGAVQKRIAEIRRGIAATDLELNGYFTELGI